jgi:hypothetical protein
MENRVQVTRITKKILSVAQIDKTICVGLYEFNSKKLINLVNAGYKYIATFKASDICKNYSSKVLMIPLKINSKNERFEFGITKSCVVDFSITAECCFRVKNQIAERVFCIELSKEEAINMLPEGELVVKSMGMLPIQYPWSRDKVIEIIKNYPCKIAEDYIASKGYGLKLCRNSFDPAYVKTKKVKCNEK